MLTFRHTSLIDAPIDTVWQFHERPDCLQQLTPPWQPVQVIKREGGLEVGAVTEFRLMLLVFPVRWVARHIQCEPPYLFVDEQVEGPLKSWIHRHQFTPEGEKTRLTDEIRYEIPGGWLVQWCLGWWVNSRLKEMFRYRHQVTQRECEKIA